MKISDLPVADAPTGEETVVVVQDEETRRVNLSALTAPAVEAVQAASDAAIAAIAGFSGFGVLRYGLGAPDAVTPGNDGDTFIDVTSENRYGPRAGGVWPTESSAPAFVGPPQDCTVIFMLGQSNADGWSADPQNTSAMTFGYGFEYYHDRGKFGSILPLGKNRLGRTQGGPQCAFAQAWAAGGGGAVVFVDCAVGGSSMVSAAKTALTGTPYVPNLSGGTWDPDDADNIYTRFIRNHMWTALDEIGRLGFRVRRQGIYFSQGEQDAAASEPINDAYQGQLRKFLRQLRLDFPTTWLMVENLGVHRDGLNAAGRAVVRAAQSTVVAEPEFSGWAKVCSTLAAGFNAGNFADTLHYNQAAYNSLGVEMATQGLAFTKSSGLVPLPDAAKAAALVKNMPPVAGWYRLRVQTSANGAWGMQIYGDPTTPYAATWYDGSGDLGVTGVDAAQALAWNWPNGNSKWAWLYVHQSTGAALSLVGQANSALTDLQVIDEGFPLHTINLGTGGSMGNGFSLSDSDIYRFSAATLRDIGINAAAPSFGGSNFTDLALGKLAGLTAIRLGRTPTAVDLNLALVPNLVTYTHNAAGLTTARVNAILQQLDANGKTNGNLQLSQYLAGFYPAAAPSGAGAAAKASLQGKGWVVTTD